MSRDAIATSQSHSPLRATEEPTDLGLTLAPADYQGLLDELKQAQALDQERVNRIQQLEQALDQALVWLDELRSQLNDQAILETQLATTEEYSHVQQQAIARLKLQLADQQQILDVQLLETQQRDQAIQELMTTIETMTETQQQELERLRSYITQDQVEVQTHRNLLEQQIQALQTTLETRQQRVADLESETLSARTLTTSLREQLGTAQQQIKDLSVRLQQHQADWAQLESQLAEVQSERQTASAKLQPPISLPISLPLQRMAASEPGNLLATLQQDLTRAHRRIEILENQLAQQIRLHAHWQQGHQQLEEERDRLQTRVVTLEQQAAEMQEQILHQARQSTEYETAVQYWKDRYLNHQRQLSHLHGLAEQMSLKLASDDIPPALLELLNALMTPIEDNETLPPPSIPLPKFPTPELPDFLVRRRDRSKGQRLGSRG